MPLGSQGGKRKADGDAGGDAARGNFYCPVCFEKKELSLAIACGECCKTICTSCRDELRPRDKCPCCNAVGKLDKLSEVLRIIEHKRARLNRTMPFSTEYLTSEQLLDIFKTTRYGFAPDSPVSHHNLMQFLPHVLGAMNYGEHIVGLALKLCEFSSSVYCQVCKASDGVVGHPPERFIADTCLCLKHTFAAENQIRGRLDNFPTPNDGLNESFTQDELEGSGACNIVLEGYPIKIPINQVTAKKNERGEAVDVHLLEDKQQPYAEFTKEGIDQMLKIRNQFLAELHPDHTRHGGRWTPGSPRSPSYSPMSPVAFARMTPSFT